MLFLLPTVLAWKVMKSPPSIRLSIYFHFIFRIDWPLTLTLCMCHDHGLQWIEGQVRGQGPQSFIEDSFLVAKIYVNKSFLLLKCLY